MKEDEKQKEKLWIEKRGDRRRIGGEKEKRGRKGDG